MKKKKKGSPPFVFNGDREFGANDVIELVAGGCENFSFDYGAKSGNLLKYKSKEVEEIVVNIKCPFQDIDTTPTGGVLCNIDIDLYYCVGTNDKNCPLKKKTFIVRLK